MPINFDSMVGLLLSTSFLIKISKLWKMNWNLDGAYNKVKDASNRPLPFEKDLFTITAKLTNVFELGKFRLGFEYNSIPKSKIQTTNVDIAGSVKDSYFGVSFGGIIGDGKR